MRFRQGAESAFAPAYEVDSGAMPGATAYASYPGGQDSGNAGYTDAPFAQPRGITITQKLQIIPIYNQDFFS
jgi:hypothetical protein